MWRVVLLIVLSAVVKQTNSDVGELLRKHPPTSVDFFLYDAVRSSSNEKSSFINNQGYPNVKPENPLTYPPPIKTTEVPTGYPSVKPDNPLTYPPPVKITTQIPIGYPSVKPDNPLTYPPPVKTTTQVPTGYPSVKPDNPLTYPPPVKTTTQVPTGYPSVKPDNPLTYPPPVKTTTQIPIGYPSVKPDNPLTYPPPVKTTTQVLTGYPSVKPENPLTYPPPIKTTPEVSSGYPIIKPDKPLTYPPPVKTTTQVSTGYPNVKPDNPLTYPPPIKATTQIPTGYPKVKPDNPLAYPPPVRTTTKIPFTYPPPVKTSTVQVQTGYPNITPDNPLTYLPPIKTSTSEIQAGYQYIPPENPFTYPPPVKTSTSQIITNYPALTPSYLPPAQTDNNNQVYLQVYPSSPLSYNSPFDKFTSGNQHNVAVLNQHNYNSHGTNLQSSKPSRYRYQFAASNIGLQTYTESGSNPANREVSSSNQFSTGNAVRRREAATSYVLGSSFNDGFYHPQELYITGDIRRSVPGEPGSDYPVLRSVPYTSFSCEGRNEGYYADMSTGCQVFHICSRTTMKMKMSFLCPNGSVFNQKLFTCDWWNHVNCSESEQYYFLNRDIGAVNPLHRQYETNYVGDSSRSTNYEQAISNDTSSQEYQQQQRAESVRIGTVHHTN